MQHCRDSVSGLKEYICSGKIRGECIIDSDYTTRNLTTMEKRLRPCLYKPRETGETVFYWIVRRGWVKLVYCIAGQEYKVEKYKKEVKDHMSGLNLIVTVAKGLVDGKTVWEIDWNRTRYIYSFQMEAVLKC